MSGRAARGAITHLSVASTARPVQDLQTDRVLELLARLISAAGAVQQELMPTGSGVHTAGAGPFLHAACAELNRLKGLAQPTDYAMLKTDGRDRFSATRLGRLADIIPAPV